MTNVVGFIDGMYHTTVVGWAIDIDNPARPVEVIVEIGGRIVGQGYAIGYRPDVATSGFPTANCGFEIHVPSEMITSSHFSVRVITSSVFLANSGSIPKIETVKKRNLSWSIDTAVRNRIAGWIVDIDKPEDNIGIDILCNGEIIATGIANSDRPDLISAGIPNQYCGFTINIKWEKQPEPYDEIAVRLSDDQTIVISYLASELGLSSVSIVGQLDALDSRFASGWVCDLNDTEREITIEVLHNDMVIASGVADLAREDVFNAGYPKLKCGYRILIPHKLLPAAGELIVVREAESRVELKGSPVAVERNKGFDCFLNARRILPDATLHRFRKLYDRQPTNHVSIVMPVYNTPLEWLNEAISSVLAQWSNAWELIIVDDCSPDVAVSQFIQKIIDIDDRVSLISTPSNSGIAAATNLGIRSAKHDIVAFMDHDDYLEPNAVLQIRRAFEIDNVDIAYSDELITGEDINSIIELRARPAFSYDYYLSHPYFVHLVSCRRSLIEKIGGLDESMNISADVDFVLRALEQARKVSHIPHVLYRWRTHPTSTGHAKQALVTTATTGAIQRSVDRLKLGCTVTPGLAFNEYQVHWPASKGKTLIIIPTKNMVDFLRKAVSSIEETVLPDTYRLVIIDHESDDIETLEYLNEMREKYIVHPYTGAFNYSKMNNDAFASFSIGCDFVLLLNNDVEALEFGWLERLCSLAARPDVGAVGPMLMYDNQQVQHAGVLIGFNGAAEHAHKLQNSHVGGQRYPGYNSSLTTCRDYSAITGACMLLKSETYRSVGGFDENLDIGFNDTDLCLRIKQLGLKILYDGFTKLYHRESATRSIIDKMLSHPENTEYFCQRWKFIFENGDEFYNPLLQGSGVDHVPASSMASSKMLAHRVSNAGFNLQIHK